MAGISNIVKKPVHLFAKLLKILLVLLLVAILVIAGINAFVWFTTKDHIVSGYTTDGQTSTLANVLANASNTSASSALNSSTASSLSTADAIVVPGASVLADGTPSTVLRDRLDTAVQLYNAGVAPAILVSGATTEDGYCEAKSMANYLIGCGIPDSVIVQDYAGFSTYATMYRAKNTFGYASVIISTQAYHLPRSVFCAQGIGISAWGVSADLGHTYSDQLFYSAREVFSNVKNAWQILRHAPASETTLTQRLANKIDSTT